MQPDFGQTVLLAGVWGAMFFMAGMPWVWISVLGSMAMAGLGLAYFTFSHVSDRIDRFLTGAGDNFQVNRGLEAITSGGWMGRGPGEGQVKYGLPDSHTDFIFSVAAEEYGIILTMVLVATIWIYCAAGSLARVEGTGSFCATGSVRTGFDVWIPSDDKYVRKSSVDAGKRYDPAVYFLWWFFIDCGGSGYGTGVGA